MTSKAQNYVLYGGKNTHTIVGDEGLENVLESLRSNERFRKSLIYEQKYATALTIAFDEMLKKKYLTRTGEIKDFKKEDMNAAGMINFSKVLKKNFPKDWNDTVVTMYVGGAMPLPENNACPSCHSKLAENEALGGYICVNDECKKAYNLKQQNSLFQKGTLFRPKDSISTFVLEPDLGYSIFAEKKV